MWNKGLRWFWRSRNVPRKAPLRPEKPGTVPGRRLWGTEAAMSTRKILVGKGQPKNSALSVPKGGDQPIKIPVEIIPAGKGGPDDAIEALADLIRAARP